MINEEPQEIQKQDQAGISKQLGNRERTNISIKAGNNVMQLLLSKIQCMINSHLVNKGVVNRSLVRSGNDVHNTRIGTTLILTAALMLLPAYAQAELKDITISGSANELIRLNLSESISNISAPEVMIPAQPASGTATVVECTNGTRICMEYQPALNFSGQVSFNYAVLNDLGVTETANITINIGNVTNFDQGSSPGAATRNTLLGVCLNEDESLDRQDIDLCAQFSAANRSVTPEDLREFIDATAPSNVGAQGALNDELTKEQLSNISRRLTALRRGQRLTVLSDLTLRYNNETITGNMFDQLLQDNASGGNAGSAFGKNWEWFISGKIGGGKQDETIYETGFEFDNYALTIGSDYRIENEGLMGWALGSGQTKMDINNNGGGMDVGNYSGTLYGSYYPSDTSYIDVIGVVTISDFDMQRRIVFGTTDETAKSDTGSTGYAISLGGGYDFAQGGFASTLNARLDYLKTTIDGYRETNADSYNVAIKKQNVSQLVSTLGAQLRYVLNYSWGVLVPHFTASWLHQFEDDADEVKGYFLFDPNAQFSFDTNAPGSNYYLLALGTSVTFANGMSSYIQYETTVDLENLTIWNMAAGLRFEW